MPGQRVKGAGRSTAYRTLRALGAIVRKVDFILWLIGAREDFKHGRDISDMFIVRNSLYLFCGNGTVGRRGSRETKEELNLSSRGGGHAWTSGGNRW